MNFNKFINSDYLKSNPLCGISTYKDELNLATGTCTRKIKKLVLTGEETWWSSGAYTGAVYAYHSQFPGIEPLTPIFCTHLVDAYESPYIQGTCKNSSNSIGMWLFDTATSSTTFKSYLAQQYAAGTPVCVWYVLATPTTETITVPSGLSGVEEGFLNQSDTPTPTNPIYPTANTVEQWFGINHYIMRTDTDTITTLPAVLYPNDTTATISIKGDMVQSGTPTPDNPIQPQETGDRTGNLLDFTALENAASGIIGTSACSHVLELTLEPNQEYTCISNGTGSASGSADNNRSIYFNNSDATNVVYAEHPVTVTTGADGKIKIGFFSSRANAQQYINNTAQVWLIKGSTPLPYEPYGQYKIPILSAGQTTPIYLGEVQSTRRIKKYELTGNENFSDAGQSGKTTILIYFSPPNIKNVGNIVSYNCFCSHYNIGSYYPPKESEGMQYTSVNLYFRTKESSTTAFKTYLAQQYAAGTPVTVWYVLATPTTGIVNEPIRKIGDYADEVSGITIPTIAGANTLSVDTTLQPSEVTVTYKGWHPVADVHERESGAWT